MNETSPGDKKDSGIDIDAVTFDESGEMDGIDESFLDSVAGGVMMMGDEGCPEMPNSAC